MSPRESDATRRMHPAPALAHYERKTEEVEDALARLLLKLIAATDVEPTPGGQEADSRGLDACRRRNVLQGVLANVRESLEALSDMNAKMRGE